MKRLLKVVLVLGFVVTLAGVGFAEEKEENWVKNPGLEEGISGWDGASAGTQIIDEEVFHSGKRSVKVIARSGITTGVAQFIPYNKEGRLLLSGYVKTDLPSGAIAAIGISYYTKEDGKWKWLGTEGGLIQVSGKNDWKKYSATFPTKKVPEGTQFLRVWCYVNLEKRTFDGEGCAWFDDISITTGLKQSKTLPDKDFVYLSDVLPVNISSLKKVDFDQSFREQTIDGSKQYIPIPIRLKGTAFKKGVSSWGNSEVIYNLEGRFDKLQSYIGIDWGSLENQQAIFEVYGDGKELFKSPPLKRDSEPFFIDIPISGVKELKLVVRNQGLPSANNWADIVVLKAGKVPPLSTGYSIEKPKEAMTIPELVEVSISPDISKEPNPVRILLRPIIYKSNKLVIWEENPCRKVFPFDKIDIEKSPRLSSVKISCAKNEYEPFQVVFSPKGEIKKVKLEFSGFKDRKGKKVSGIGFDYKIAGWTFIEQKSYERTDEGGVEWAREREEPTDTRRIGYTPDPLIPLTEVNLRPGINYSFWCTIFVPSHFNPGDYTGKIKVIADNKELAEIPVDLHIWNFSVEDRYGLDMFTAVCFPWAWVVPPFSQEIAFNTIFPEVLKDMKKHHIYNYIGWPFPSYDSLLVRISLDSDKNIVVDTKNYEKIFDLCVNELKYKRWILSWANVFQYREDAEAIKLFGNPFLSDEWIRLNKQYLKAMKEIFIKKGFPLEKVVLNLWDEPYCSSDPDKIYSDIVRYANIVKEVFPEAKVYTSCFLVDRLIPVQDIFMEKPHSACYVESSKWDWDFNRKRMKRTKEIGKELWTSDGAVTLNIEHLGIEPRILPYIHFKYDMTGCDYWSINAWYTSNPWITPATYMIDKSHWQNGNGCLLYPWDRMPYFIPSIRYEVLREGLEDYIYLQTLKGMIEEGKKKKVPSDILKEAEDTLKKAKNIVLDPIEDKEEISRKKGEIVFGSSVGFNPEPEELYKIREEVAKAIEKLKRRISGS